MNKKILSYLFIIFCLFVCITPKQALSKSLYECPSDKFFDPTFTVEKYCKYYNWMKLFTTGQISSLSGAGFIPMYDYKAQKSDNNCRSSFNQSIKKVLDEYKDNKCKLTNNKLIEMQYGHAMCRVMISETPVPRIIYKDEALSDVYNGTVLYKDWMCLPKCWDNLYSSLKKSYPKIKGVPSYNMDNYYKELMYNVAIPITSKKQ